MWIEITNTPFIVSCRVVTPFAGVWIEISTLYITALGIFVTPFAGVWIEIVPQLYGPA